jgi:hypothetical protein
MTAKLKPEKKLQVLEYWHWQCRMPRCLHPAELGGRLIDRLLMGTVDDWAPTVDHKQRRSDSGTNAFRNLRPAHRRCNQEDAIRLDRLAAAGVKLSVAIGAEAAKALLGLRDTL